MTDNHGDGSQLRFEVTASVSEKPAGAGRREGRRRRPPEAPAAPARTY